MSLTSLVGGVLGSASSQKSTSATNLVKGAFQRKRDKGRVAAPTIDEARIQRQETDRIRRRRGTLANIQAGEAAPATVGTRALLGA